MLYAYMHWCMAKTNVFAQFIITSKYTQPHSGSLCLTGSLKQYKHAYPEGMSIASWHHEVLINHQGVNTDGPSEWQTDRQTGTLLSIITISFDVSKVTQSAC
jgi:hypothetical protein